ncbi:DUF6775 family putative metallopeptidase [Nitrosopumilus sp.]|uniref:DUF6775 family putative metallopeptidase n=1 Tax=Nitrosopumilus sp. TaxID=2024843 RepID=UPI00247E23F9|nr:DUF6775 family putative metallopeptidase [Nitrosopumilus sp.]MCV0410165.1 hypothetical protein [Nitrosopumilus sp.]
MKISKIILYDEPTVLEIQLEKLEKFLEDAFPIQIEIRDNFFRNLNDETYKKIASTRIFDIKKPFQKHNVSMEDILIEKENIDTSEKEEMALYDGIELYKVISEQIPKEENNMDVLNIIFTNKLTGTFDENDFRYHARALIGSNPTIISTTGIIEAPAKPKQYYLDLMTNFSNEEIDTIKKKYEGEFLEYHDSRISEAIEGYLLQAIIYYETGEAFCTDKECRLYNAHWQKELISTQLKNKKFCDKHKEMLKKLT